MNDIKIRMENIGGITKPTTFILKPGLNIVKAPNAIGKSSFVHGIQTMILPEGELKQHTEFLNDFSTDGKVEITEGKNIVYRKLRHYGNELSIVGDPFYNGESKANLLSIAIPENEFLDNILKGKPLDTFFEEFSDAKNYQKLLDWCKDGHRELLIEQNKYFEIVKRLQATQEEIEKHKKELDELEKERIKLKPILETITKGKFDQKLEELGKKRERRTTLYSRIEELKYHINVREKELPRLEKESKQLDEEISQFHKNHPDVDKDIDKLWDKIMEFKKIREDIRNELENNEHSLEACEHGEGDMCNECGRPFIAEQRRKRISELSRKKTETKKELLSRDNQIKEMELERTSLMEERDRILTDMQRELKDISGTLTKYERDIKDWKKELEEKIELMDELEEKINDIEKAIDPKTREILRKTGEIEGNIGKIEGILKIYKEEVEGLSENQKIVQKLQRKTEFLKLTIPYITERINQLKDAARHRFNKGIMEVYNILGFKDFEKIEIDDMFRLTVKRKHSGLVKTQELNRLSTSERITIGVIVMLAGKEEYLQDFPFFVLDEVTTSYDPKRFERIISYIQRHVPYAIVTKLAPIGESLQVEHKI